MPKLTKTYIDNVQPPDTGYKIHWDDRVAGYGLRITASGVKAFIAQGRVHGKAVIVTIGRYKGDKGLWTEAQARDEARRILLGMRDGINPNAAKKAAAEAAKVKEAEGVTLGEVCAAYLDRPGKLREVTAREYQRHIDKTLATWKDLPIASITADMVVKRHREIVEHGLEGKRGAPASANAAMVTLRALIKFASRRYRQADGSPLILYNPTEALYDQWAELGDRTEECIDHSKVGEVWNLLADMRAAEASPKNRAAIDVVRFALLTGCRKREVTELTWDRVDIADDASKCRWFLTGRKRGKDIWLPLSTAAVELLTERRRETAGRFVFPSTGKTGHILDARAQMERVSKLAGRHLSLHALRRTLVLREMERAVGTIPVIKQDKAGVSRIVGKITPREVRDKRAASAKVYRQHA